MKYGAAYHAYVDVGDYYETVGAVEDEGDSIAVIGNDLEKIEQYFVTATTEDNIKPYVTRSHLFVGRKVADIGENVVSVICFDDEDEQIVLAVIFEDPDLPLIIE